MACAHRMAVSELTRLTPVVDHAIAMCAEAAAPVSADLLDWCRAGGVQWHGIQAAYVAEGWRGVMATRDIPAGTCILRVPRRLLMSVESAKRDPEFSAALLLHGAGISSEQTLAAHLLHEAARGPKSFWHPYICSLPRTYTTAMCLTGGEAAELQAAHAVQAARAAAEAALQQHEGALPLLRALRLEPKWRSRGAWLWAASTLSSRTMYLPSDPAGALTPFGDLHNYRPPPPPFAPTQRQLLAAAAALAAEASPGNICDVGAPAAGTAGAAAGEQAGGLAGDGHLDEAAGLYCLTARACYAAGEQVFLCYGRHTNLELLCHYGFVLPPGANPHDTALLPPRMLPEAVQQQLGLERQGGDRSDGAAAQRAYLHASGAPSWELLRALRLGCAAPAERRTLAHRALADWPVSGGSERAAFAALRQACQSALDLFPTTREQDEGQLAALGLPGEDAAAPTDAACAARSPGADAADQRQRLRQQHVERLRVVLQWRLEQKCILGRGVALCEAVLAALNASPGPPVPQLAAVRRAVPRW